MEDFNSQSYFQQLIANHTLVQVYAQDNDTYEVGHLFSINDQELIYSSFTSAGDFDGVCLAKIEYRGVIKTQTYYLQKFARQISVDDYYQRAQQLLANFKFMAWHDWFQTLVLNKMPVSLTDTNNHDHEGIVIGSDEQVVLIKTLNQYTDQNSGTVCFKHNNLSAITIGSGWINTISAKLTKK